MNKESPFIVRSLIVISILHDIKQHGKPSMVYSLPAQYFDAQCKGKAIAIDADLYFFLERRQSASTLGNICSHDRHRIRDIENRYSRTTLHFY